MEDERKGLDVLDRAECLALMSTVRFGRVAFTAQALPAVQPAGFVLEDGDVVICAPAGSELAGLAGGTVVAFEADDLDLAEHDGWSVTVVGRVWRMHDPSERVRVSLHRWSRGPAPHFLRISSRHMTGRRITDVTPNNHQAAQRDEPDGLGVAARSVQGPRLIDHIAARL